MCLGPLDLIPSVLSLEEIVCYMMALVQHQGLPLVSQTVIVAALW